MQKDNVAFASLLECLTEEVVFENLSGASTTTRVKGEAAFAELAWQSARLVSERKQPVKACIAAGSRVAIKVDDRTLSNGWAGDPVGGRVVLQSGPRAHQRPVE